MASKMDLILAGPAGHILAAGTRQDLKGPQPDAAALVGDGLRIRDPVSGETRLSVVAAQLSVSTIDLREDVVMMAPRFILVDGLPEEGANPAATPAAFNGTTVTVNLPVADPNNETTVWVYVDGGPQPIVQKVQVAKGLTTKAEPLVLASGDYTALVLTPGCRAAIVETTIP